MPTTQLSLQLPLEPTEQPRYLREFPDFGLMDHPIPSDMIDASRGSNACPSFEMPAEDPDQEPLITLFVDYKNPDKRAATINSPEVQNARFNVHVGAAMDVPALATDSWEDVEEFITLRRPFAGFEHDGMWITNPTCEDGGARFVVSPEVYGFVIEQTGGGCTAWVRRLFEGGHLVLTDLGGTSHELGDVLSTFLIGVYDAESTELSMHHAVVGVISNAGANFDGTAAIPPDPKFTPMALANYRAVEENEAVKARSMAEGVRSLHAVATVAAPVEEGVAENFVDEPAPAAVRHHQVFRVTPAIPERIFDHVAHNRAVADLEAMGLHSPSPAEITSQAIANASSEGLIVLETLRKQLAQALNFIEHKLANEGKVTTNEHWDHNVRAFRLSSVSHIGIGHDHVDKASIDLTKSRAALASAKSFMSKHQAR